MKYDVIKPGDLLRLKSNRLEDYGLRCSAVKVLSLKYHDGYKVPYVRCEYSHYGETLTGYFKPSDFAGAL